MRVTLDEGQLVDEDWHIGRHHLVTRTVDEGKLQTTLATGGFPWTPFY